MALKNTEEKIICNYAVKQFIFIQNKTSKESRVSILYVDVQESPETKN